jgi:AcrR family transcriptional regulator
MAGRGRSRDLSIDARLLEVAAKHLAAYGYEGMSLTRIADEAGTTRQALYRRWADKAELGAAAMADVVEQTNSAATGHPFSDLIAELSDFQRGVSRPGRLSLVGSMLQDSVERDVRASYRARVIAPRRRRLRLIFERAQRLGLIDAEADLDGFLVREGPRRFSAAPSLATEDGRAGLESCGRHSFGWRLTWKTTSEPPPQELVSRSQMARLRENHINED